MKLLLCTGLCQVFTILQLKADRGILRHKPINSSGAEHLYPNRYGTDGRLNTFCSLMTSDSPFFLVDLQLLYILHRVFITCRTDRWRKSARNTIIGASRGGETFTPCGRLTQEPPESSTLSWTTLEFPCVAAGPARYVKLWKEERGRLGFMELDADGVTHSYSAQLFHKRPSRRVTNSTSVSASSHFHCSVLCHLDLCRVFSYSSGNLPNCLLADCSLTVGDQSWDSWSDEDS